MESIKWDNLQDAFDIFKRLNWHKVACINLASWPQWFKLSNLSFVLEEVAFGQVFRPELGYFPDSIIPTVLSNHIHSSTIDAV